MNQEVIGWPIRRILSRLAIHLCPLPAQSLRRADSLRLFAVALRSGVIGLQSRFTRTVTRPAASTASMLYGVLTFLTCYYPRFAGAAN